MASHNVGHNERLYRANREALKLRCQAEGIPCAHCGEPFSWHASPRHPKAFSADHIKTRAEGGARDDPANMIPAHYGCNSARGDKPLATHLEATRKRTRQPLQQDPKSEQWP